jgi:hypothetical protein
MSIQSLCVGCAIAVVSCTVVGFAQTSQLNVKLGLWEMTSTSNIGGEMSIDTSKMTPDQKAKMEAAMKAMMGPQVHVTKTCITKEDLAEAKFMMGDDRDAQCEQTLTTNTKTTLDVTMSCPGEHASTGQMHIEAPSPTSIKAVMKGSNTSQGKTTTMDVTMNGKWLAAECGDVH